MNPIARGVALLGAVLCALPVQAAAQYFGRNKVQYEKFSFEVLRTQHFDVYFYPEEAAAARQAARMAERWYQRLSTILKHELRGKQPLILYADHADFEQTNVLADQIGEGTGGVTESIKRRIILPFGASLEESDHVIGHELVHAFQYDMSGVGRGSMVSGGGLNRLPLWFIEGMAEYLSVGPVDPHTMMWMRDAARRAELPDLGDLANPRFFPYRYGQAFWAYLGGTYGDPIVGAALRLGGRSGDVRSTLQQVTGRSADSLVADWHAAMRAAAQPVAQATGVDILPRDADDERREAPGAVRGARLLVGGEGGEGRLNIAPALSADGTRMVYLSEASLLSIDLYLADARTGKTIRKLVSSTRDPHLESMQFINSAGAWDPSSRRFAFGAIVRGKPALRIVDGENGDLEREVRLPALGEIVNPTWAPDGKAIAFSAQVGGLTDLFIYDLEGERLRRLTNDPFADLEPAWSPDGSTIAFVTDRWGTALAQLTYGNYALALVDVNSGRLVRVPELGDAKHINPQWSPDGQSLFFLADPGGITNVYRVRLADGAISQITNVYTGVSGITPLSPALSVAARDGRTVFTLYSNDGYELHVMDDPAALAGQPPMPAPPNAARLPPARREAGVLAMLSNPLLGLPESLPDSVRPYRAGFSLDFVAQPSVAVGADRFGTYVGGGITLFWSDMLGDHSLVTMAQLNGRLQDFAALVGYENRRSRWNWSLSAQQIPYITGAFGQYFTTIGGQTALVEEVERFRQTNRQLLGVVAYPFNRARRFEMAAGLQNISFGHELERRAVFQNGAVAFDSTINFPAPDALNLGVASAALVHDNAFFGATSPILGDRWRLEVAPTVGSLTFATALVDYRRYLMPVRPFTIAGRLLHIGRYGEDSDDARIYPLFIGYPSLVRGYDVGSFSATECPSSTTGCPVFDQLLGSRMLVANVELRFPPFGLLGLGGGYYGVLPLEAAIFYDAGVAWTSTEGTELFGTGSRPIVRSAGVSLRLNLMGFAVGQFDFVRPFDRPEKNWMFRFSLTPGY